MRALIFVHYDKHGILDPHVEHSLKAYRECFDYTVLVSASLKECPANARKWIDAFIPRSNVGYDFCSWKAGLNSTLELHDLNELFFVNDSVYGPIRDIRDTLTFGERENLSLWGMVLSVQSPSKNHPRLCPHVQSWFFGVRRPLLFSSEFMQYWEGVRPLESKQQIIENYEVGMSNIFQGQGHSIGGVYDMRLDNPVRWLEVLPNLSIFEPRRSFKHFRRARKTPYNPSELRWERIIESGVPFLKVNLLRTNHYGIKKARTLEYISQFSDYDPKLIVNHQRRIAS